MCKPHYRADYYQRNKAHENASNRAYINSRPGYQRARHVEYWEALHGDERRAKALELAARLAATHKTCTRCLASKPKTDFYADAKRRDGRYSWCSECFNTHMRDAYDPAASAARNLLWARANPTAARQKTHRYRARKMDATIGEVDFAAIIIRDGMVCHICSIDIESMSDLHFDHVRPLARGGAHSMDNIKPSHARCNLRKGAKLIA
ncbi:HNH endonuclease [Cryobacterium soli]|uniref:HNH endonuclease n=1 Tax=Cryobacterium soli TaxID=2220095 RepID=UPI000E75288A|nr:HNH endonuclease signature motif containing protein [Cryobacterium soli]